MESPRTVRLNKDAHPLPLISARRHGEALANREIRKLSISGRLLLALNRLQRQSCMRLSRFIRCVSFSGLNLMGEAAGGADTANMFYLWPDRSGSMVNDGVAHSSDINAFMQQSLARANFDGRLIGGFKHVIDAVQNDPQSLLFCILPENLWNNPLHRAFFSLLVSACCEHGVRMIKVDHDQLVRKIVEMSADPNSPLPDLSYECLAIRASVSGARLLCDRELLRFHQRHPGNDFSQLPLINLLES
uniref:DUF58 domain-containing protein n=2 Tax=Macrostomum lignano TaxID=282301 RepID=A0A1I8GME2_9PLAT